MNILKLKTFAIAVLVGAFLSSCSSDDSPVSGGTFVVAFETLSANLTDIETTANIHLVYSKSATTNGSATINVEGTGAVYGVDFTTVPEAVDGVLILNIESGTSSTDIVFNKLNPNLDEITEISFTISAIDYPSSQIQGNSVFLLNSAAALGGTMAPEMGGPNEQFQVYVNLSGNSATQVQRDSWDLGFYSGNEFRVALNGSIYMAAAQLASTNMDDISESDVVDLQPLVAVGTFDPANEIYIDYPDGDILKTAIDEVSATLSENKVYLVNLGFEVGTETPPFGDVAISGDHRGWKKIRVIRNGNDYVLQYANLNDTSHQEITVPKNAAFNFTFFSFNTNSVVNVEPEKDLWDLNFTVFTNIIEGAGSYGYTDGVLHNRKGGVVAYSVSTDDFSYDNFLMANVSSGSFQQDQRAIGSSWRDVMNQDKVLIDTIFYIIKDANNNIYKLKFTGLLSESGERGYPEFKYELLQ